MRTKKQAEAYLKEAELTLESAQAILHSAEENNENLWAQVVKNGYDAIEQAASAGIAKEGADIPRNHPGKINSFIEIYRPGEEIEDALLYWLRLRSDTQYVDIRGDEINVPHKQFTSEDAKEIISDVKTIIRYVKGKLD